MPLASLGVPERVRRPGLDSVHAKVSLVLIPGLHSWVDFQLSQYVVTVSLLHGEATHFFVRGEESIQCRAGWTARLRARPLVSRDCLIPIERR